MSTDAARFALLPAVIATAAAEAAAALALAGPRGLLLLSAEGAAGFLGPQAWRALVDAAAAAAPGTPRQDALCCAAGAGDALLALRAGCRLLVLDGGLPAFPAVAAAAAEIGARLLPARPPALDLRRLDLRREAGRARLAAWLAEAPERDDKAGPLR